MDGFSKAIDLTLATYESTTVQIPHPEFGACALVQDLLPLYLEGEVSPGSRDTIVEHLARCERCASFLAGAQSVRAQFRRDQALRGAAVRLDRPVRQAIGVGQRLATMVLTLALRGLGAIGSLLAGVSVDAHAPLLFLFQPPS
jgi:anti-sigma factor RsiW